MKIAVRVMKNHLLEKSKAFGSQKWKEEGGNKPQLRIGHILRRI